MKFRTGLGLTLLILPLAPGCWSGEDSDTTTSSVADQASVSVDRTEPAGAPEENVPAAELKWQELFDGNSLVNWESSNFGGEGEVLVVDGKIRMAPGRPLTGIAWTGDELATTNYRVRVEAKKTQGSDFFCCLTFPVADAHCSLVVGGWAGTVVGLSSIDGNDASDNSTTLVRSFELDRWYQIEVEVADNSIRCWLDGELIVDQPRSGHAFSIRNEVERSRPLGICAFATAASIRRVAVTPIASNASAGDVPEALAGSEELP